MIAIPGLIDAHQHPNQYLLSGVGDLMTWLFGRVYPYEAALTEEAADTEEMYLRIFEDFRRNRIVP